MAEDQPAPPGVLLRGPESAALPGAEVLSRLGHELRGPLNGIVGLVRVMLLKLAAGAPDPAQQVHHLKLLQASADQLETTVERVVEFARLETAPPATAAWTDCCELVARVAARHQPASGDGPRVLADVADRPVLVPGTPQELDRLLTELVDNAIRHSGATEIVLRARPATVGTAAAIEVQDDGAGIPYPDQDRIFRPFERGESAAREPGHGAGLGLSLATGRAARLGMHITLASEPGRGSTFTIHCADPATPSGQSDPRTCSP
ncbi:MAG TPA: HAMP domain-containing sensor histidine kinase [Actinoplanes sp.]|nr:HAMP domain-containing sensor histidine kinase [Actinoplanes sp.]